MRLSWIACTAVTLLTIAVPSNASLVLTADGVSDGFQLTTFVGGYSAQYGPLAQGIAPNGNVITGSLLGQKIYSFSDVDNQTLANALGSVP